MNNLQEYLESGLVEQYALGALPPAERAAVEAQAAAHPAVAAALAEAVAALDGYALAHAVAPPPALRTRVLGAVLAQIAADAVAATPAAAEPAAAVPVVAAPVASKFVVAAPVVAESAAAAPSAAPVAAVAAEPVLTAGSVATPVPVAATANAPAASLRADVDALARPAAPAPLLGQRVAPAPAGAGTGRPWLAVAASVALLLSLLGNFFLYSRWRAADSDLVALQADQTRLASANTVLQRELGGVKTQNDILRDDRFKVIALAGTPDAPGAKARVFFDPATRKVYFDARNMPALPAGKQYQLWALHNGKPVDAGLVVSAATAADAAAGLQAMKPVAAAQAFAVTVEPAGGSAGPTMPIRAMGAVTI